MARVVARVEAVMRAAVVKAEEGGSLEAWPEGTTAVSVAVTAWAALAASVGREEAMAEKADNGLR